MRNSISVLLFLPYNENKMKAIYTIGVSSSGKSYWSNEFVKNNPNYLIIERDKIRADILRSLCTYREGFLWKVWDFKDEHKVNEIVQQMIDFGVKNNKDIIFSNTNLNKKYLLKSIQQMTELGYKTEMRYFPVDFELAIERDKKRTETVGIDVIEKQWLQWLELPRECIGIPKYIKDDTKPKAVVCDIDGTVARHVNRNPYDYFKAGTDEPITEVVNIVKMYKENGYQIIFLSGRDSVCREITNDWLGKHFGSDFLLYMRTQGDRRKDRIVKQELFFNHVAENWDVEVVIDDRKQVVRLWTDIDVKLLNVGNYYETF
jgi:predicted kinase